MKWKDAQALAADLRTRAADGERDTSRIDWYPRVKEAQFTVHDNGRRYLVIVEEVVSVRDGW